MAISFKGAKKYKKHNGFTKKSEIIKPLPAPFHFYKLRQGENILSPLINEGGRVLRGQKIADIAEFSANPVISSVSGIVTSVTEACITIENDAMYSNDIFVPPAKKIENMTAREILWLLREGGVYEQLAASPLHLLLSEKNVRECIIVCCFDSDPYVSSPQAAASKNAEKILRSLSVAMRVSGITKAFIAVENDTKNTFYDFKYNLRYRTDITLTLLKARYPQSDEKILSKLLTGSEDTSYLMISPETLCNMADVLESGIKITDKLVTVSGDDILEPNNFSVPLGTPVSSLIESAGYANPEVVISGGIIDGTRINDLDQCISQDTKAILAFNDKANIPKYRKEPV